VAAQRVSYGRGGGRGLGGTSRWPGMILVNRTGLPDAVLRVILKKAARAVKARIAGTRVYVGYGRGGGRALGGTSRWPGGQVWLTVRHHVKGRTYPTSPFPEQAEAERFFETARHEWAHVAEFQTHGHRLPSSGWTTKRRRPRWKTRPEEIRAENILYEADERGRGAKWAKAEIAALALALKKEAG